MAANEILKCGGCTNLFEHDPEWGKTCRFCATRNDSQNPTFPQKITKQGYFRSYKELIKGSFIFVGDAPVLGLKESN